MTPTAVLIQPTTTTTIMTSTASNILSNNDFSLSNGTNGPTSSHFGVYQQTLVRSNDVSIQKLVPASISTVPYCKALIAKFFFHQIIDFPNTPSVSFRNLMTTVASYLSLNTGVTERKVEKAVFTILSNFFGISNLQGVGFADTSGKPITVLDLDQRHVDLTYSTSRSLVSTPIKYNRALDESLSIELSLRLPQTLVSLLPSTGQPLAATVNTPAKLVTTIGFHLDNYIDNILDEIGEDIIQNFLTDAKTNFPVRSSVDLPSNLISMPTSASEIRIAPSLTPKIDCVHSIASTSDTKTFMGSIDFMDSQSSFYLVSNSNPTMIRLS